MLCTLEADEVTGEEDLPLSEIFNIHSFRNGVHDATIIF